MYKKTLQPVIEETHLIPDHQFGFRKHHSKVEQVHRIVNFIKESIEEKI